MLTADEQDHLFEVLGATMEVMGQEYTPAALMLMVSDLSAYPLNETQHALARCRSEVKGRLTLACIVERIPSANAHLPAAEAWALALSGQDESETIIWNGEVAGAMADARPILALGDKVGARMAFMSSYERRVELTKAEGRQPNWTASLGSDPARRQDVIEQAVEQARIAPEQAKGLLPSPDRLEAKLALPPSPEEQERRRRNANRMIQEIRHALSSESRNDLMAQKRQREREQQEQRRQQLLAQAEQMAGSMA